MIQGLFNTGSMPVLERMVQFAGVRHRLITHNIANASTPGFRPTDLSVASFQQALRDAIDHRRETYGGPTGDLPLRDTRELRFGPDRLAAKPRFAHDNLMFHDKNDRSLEHMMQDLAENAMAHNAALEMLNNQFTMLQSAIREQV